MSHSDRLSHGTHEVGGRTLRIGQIWYDERSRARLDPLFVPIRNRGLGRFFEAEVIRDAIAARWHEGADLVGIFSWRFSEKFPLRGGDVLSLVEGAPRSEVYTFFGALAPAAIWPTAERKHPGILTAAQLLLRRLAVGTPAGELVAPPVYQHHFIAAAEVYERFVEEMLAPAIGFMVDAGDSALQAALDVDSGYRDARHTPELTRSVFGLDWLPLHPFVAERLFSTWLALNPAVGVHPLWSGRFVAEADLAHEPELRAGRS